MPLLYHLVAFIMDSRHFISMSLFNNLVVSKCLHFLKFEIDKSRIVNYANIDTGNTLTKWGPLTTKPDLKFIPDKIHIIFLVLKDLNLFTAKKLALYFNLSIVKCVHCYKIIFISYSPHKVNMFKT